MAGPGREINEALSYLWQLNPNRLVQTGYIDMGGAENSRVVRGEVVPSADLLKNVRSWPSYALGASAAPGTAVISPPFLSPGAGVPVVAAITPVAVDDKVRAYVELELAVSALERQLSADLERSEGIALVDRTGHILTSVGGSVSLDGWQPGSTLATVGSSRVAAEPVPQDTVIGGPWYVVAAAPPPTLLSLILAPAQLTILIFAALALALAGISLKGARRRAAEDLATEQRAREEAERLSRIDMLTGLFNRRHVMESIEHELARSARDGSAVGLIMFDIDYFKRINDAHGHGGGDAVLVEVARRLRSGVRQWDLVARVGGEEFCVVAPSMDSEAAVAELGDRLRHALAERAIIVKEGVAMPVTVSAGAALVRFQDGSADQGLDRADRALYSAKRRGRNRLCTFSSLDEADMRAEQPECLHLAEALARASELRDGAAKDHAARVAELATGVAHQLGLREDEVLRVQLGGWLHDIGKIGVPDHLIGEADQLSDSDQDVIRRHPIVGVELLAKFPELTMAAPAVRHHHERYDGAGYPDKLAGDQIPLEARIVAVADAFCSLTFDPPKRRRLATPAALVEIRRAAGTRFDPIVVAAFEASLHEGAPTRRVVTAA